ncbi:MAG: MFS transporter, partial [Limnohabitans sp.]
MMARPRLALAATLLVQLLATMSLTCASVLAPAVAPALGLPPERIGWYAGLAYLMAMLSGLRSGVWVVHLGGVRLSQLSLLACAAGLLLAVLVPPAALLLTAMLIGAGYGLSNPAAAQVLAHHAPASATGLFFSIKQAGVPLGVALCGLLMPWGL